MSGTVTEDCPRRLWILCLLVMAFAQTAWAQQDGPAAPVVLPPSPGVPADSWPSGLGDHVCPDYWIISTRDCPQSLNHPPYGEPTVLHAHGSSCAHQTNLEEFLGALQPSVPVCIVVHGSFVNWRDVVLQSHHTYRWIRAAAPRQPLHVVFLTWPSDSCLFLPRTKITHLGRQSAYNGHYLAQLLCRIPCDHPISLVGHSHGARLILAALHLRGGGDLYGQRMTCRPPGPQRIRTVLAAAALEHDWLNPGERYDLALGQTECLLNLQNRKDCVLAFYPWLHIGAEHTLGKIGLGRDDYCQLGPQAAKITSVEVDGLVRHQHGWPAYYAHPEFADLMVPYIYFRDPAELPPNPAPNRPADLQESSRFLGTAPRRMW